MQITKRKPNFFYGWVMLGVATLTQMLTIPGQTAGVSLFTPSFEQALNLTRTQQTGAYAMGTLIASLAMTYVGAQMDRFGIRRVLVVIVVLFGIACVYTGFVTGFWTLFIAFLFLRMFGQGSMSLLSNNTAAMWFDKRLGLAQATVGIGFSIAITIMPPVAFWMIEQFGWRTAYPMLGGLVVVIMLPLLFFVFINRPEDIGQQRDGDWVGEISAEAAGSEYEFTLQEALRTPAFWIFAGMMFAVSMIVTAVTFNALFMFEEFGLSNAQTVTVISTIGLTTAFSLLIAGYLADIFPMRWLGLINMLGQISALTFLLFVNAMWVALAYAVALGLFGSLHQAVVGPVWARYYGRAHLGKIRGAVFTAGVAGSSLGPFAMGALFDLTGSYTPSILIFIGVYAVIAVLTPFAKRPTPPAAQ